MSFVISKRHKRFLYEQVITLVDDMVCQGTLCPGDKLPSLRAMASKLEVSIPTVKQAYQTLEAQGKVRAQEKSGYFLQAAQVSSSMPKRVSCRKNRLW